MSEETLQCDVHTEQIKQLKQDTTDQWTHINTLENALRKLVPIWTTIILMMMSGVTGAALTFAGMIIRFTASKSP